MRPQTKHARLLRAHGRRSSSAWAGRALPSRRRWWSPVRATNTKGTRQSVALSPGGAAICNSNGAGPPGASVADHSARVEQPHCQSKRSGGSGGSGCPRPCRMTAVRPLLCSDCSVQVLSTEYRRVPPRATGATGVFQRLFLTHRRMTAVVGVVLCWAGGGAGTAHCGLMITAAAEHGALILALEHRYALLMMMVMINVYLTHVGHYFLTYGFLKNHHPHSHVATHDRPGVSRGAIVGARCP